MITVVCGTAIFFMHSSASAATGPIPVSETGAYPRSQIDSSTYYTSTVTTPDNSNLSFAGAVDTVNKTGGPTEGSINNAIYLWCSNGEYEVEEDSGVGNCSSTEIKDNGIDERAFRPQGVLGQESDYDLIVQSNLVYVGVTVHLIGGCENINDSDGFEDHSTSSLSVGGNQTVDDLTAGAWSLDSATHYGDQATCSGGNISLPISPTDFTSSNSLGPNYKEVLIKVSLPNSNSAVGKVFGVETTAGYIGPADATVNQNNSGLFTNLQDPTSDYFYNVHSDCHTSTGPNPPYCPSQSTGGYSAWTRGAITPDNTPSTYNFYFSPDCSYKNGDTVNLNWQDGEGDAESQAPNEQWVLKDMTTGGNIVYGPVTYNNLNSPGVNVGGKVNAGDTYDWQWSYVDRAHGISVQLPYSEFTATNEFNSATDCTKSWTLNGTSSVTPTTPLTSTSQTATFYHYVQNDIQSANQATFTWQIQGQYNNGGWDVENNGNNGDDNGAVPFSHAYCVSAANNNCLQSGSSTLNPGGTTNAEVETYRFPDNASPGSTYCERIEYDYANGPTDTAETADSPVACVTYQPNDNSVCSWLNVDSGSAPAGSGYNGLNYDATSNNVVIAMAFNNQGGTTWGTNYGIQYIGGNETNLKYNGISNGHTYIFNGYNYTDGTLHYANNNNNPSGNYDFQMVNANGQRFGALCTVHITWPAPNCVINGPASDRCSATCGVSASGQGPNGIVLEDGAINFTVTIYNTSGGGRALPLNSSVGPLQAWSGDVKGEEPNPTDGFYAYDPNPAYRSTGYVDETGYSDGFSQAVTVNGQPQANQVPPGGSASTTVLLPAPYYLDSVYIAHFAHPGYPAGDILGGSCATSFDTYTAFKIQPVESGTFNPNGNTENPQSYTYSAYASNVDGNNPVNNDGVAACGYISPANYGCPGTGQAIFGDNSYPGTWYAAPIYLLNGTQPVIDPQAGQGYCLDMYVSVYSGYADGAGNISPYGQSGPLGLGPTCQTIDNKPYFKVYGSGASAGGEFKSTFASPTQNSCSNPNSGALAGWNNDTGSYPPSTGGSGSQFAAFALQNIYGFASAQPDNNTPTGARSWTDLTFANEDLPIPIDPYSIESSPSLGGDFSSGSAAYERCLTSPQVDLSKTTPVNAPATPIVVGTNPGDINNGSYEYNGNVTIGGDGSNLQNADNLTVFVKGNVYINNNINYNAAGWSVNVSPSGTTTNVPSMQLVVSGNIYIASTVTSLDGTYIAEYQTVGDGNGRIYTCASGIGAPIYLGGDNSYGACDRQLTVNGSFVADKINLQRTFGSLRDSINNSNENPNSSTARACSNNTDTGNSSTCAAEVFNFSPELYLSGYNSAPTCSAVPCSASLSGEPPIL
jgi:hypothetical protein